MQKTTPLRPHRVLSKKNKDGELHALILTDGLFEGIVFSYSSVSFEEDLKNDKLKLKFEYDVYEVPEDKVGYDKEAFEKELGDFMVELLFYGLERDHMGFIDEQNRENYPFEFNSQRGVLPQGGAVS